jgi:hypothetical protein
MTDNEPIRDGTVEQPPKRVFQEREASDPRLVVTLGGVNLPEADDGTVPEDLETTAEHAAMQVVSKATERHHLTPTWITADYRDPTR